jgi:hypothetical protein
VLRSFNSAVFDTLNSIDGLSSGAFPVAVIRLPLLGNADLLLFTLLVLAAGRKACTPQAPQNPFDADPPLILPLVVAESPSDKGVSGFLCQSALAE